MTKFDVLKVQAYNFHRQDQIREPEMSFLVLRGATAPNTKSFLCCFFLNCCYSIYRNTTSTESKIPTYFRISWHRGLPGAAFQASAEIQVIYRWNTPGSSGGFFSFYPG